MSLNILENSNIKDYINPNFNTFNCNNFNLNGIPLLDKQSYTGSTSNLVNLSSAIPISDFYYEKIGTSAVKITGGVDATLNVNTFLISFEISLPPGITYTPGNKAYGVSYAKRAGATRSAGISIQPIITASNTLSLEYIRGINLNPGNIVTICFDLYVEL
jgi:hypothetical protein